MNYMDNGPKTKRRSLLIVPEFQLRHPFWLLRGLVELAEEAQIEVCWTNRKWHPPAYGPGGLLPEDRLLPPDVAFTRLADGGFDCVLFSDGTQAAYLTRHLRNTTKVFMDCSDPGWIQSGQLRWADLYLKCQYPARSALQMGDAISLVPYNGHAMVIPWPYCPNNWLQDAWLEEPTPPTNTVFFCGWSWPQARFDTLKAVYEAGLPLRGGLYERPGILLNIPVPDGLCCPQMPFREYLAAMRASRLVLNATGNGQQCFRWVEAMWAGSCVVSRLVDVQFPGRDPIAGQEWFPCTSDAELVGVCRDLLDAPEVCETAGKAARSYFDQYLSPKAHARRLLGLLNWEANT